MRWPFLLVFLLACDAPPEPFAELTGETVATGACAVATADGFIYWAGPCSPARSELHRRALAPGPVEDLGEVPGWVDELVVGPGTLVIDSVGAQGGQILELGLDTLAVTQAVVTVPGWGSVQNARMLRPDLGIVGATGTERQFLVAWPEGLSEAPVIVADIPGRVCGAAAEPGGEVLLAVGRESVCRSVIRATVTGASVTMRLWLTRWPVLAMVPGLEAIELDDRGQAWFEREAGPLTPLPAAGDQGVRLGSGEMAWLAVDRLFCLAADGTVRGSWVVPLAERLLRAADDALVTLGQGAVTLYRWPP